MINGTRSRPSGQGASDTAAGYRPDHDDFPGHTARPPSWARPDDATKRLGAVLLLLADEVDRLSGVVDRLTRQVR
jgi:hypothetical protein